jgi:NAD-dependent DNA ligase
MVGKRDLDLAAALQLLPLQWYGSAVPNLAREFGTWDQFLGCLRAAREDLARLRQRWPGMTLRDYIESVKYGMPDAPSPSEAAKLYPAMSRLVDVYDVGFATAAALLTDDEVLEVASTMVEGQEIKPDSSFGSPLSGKEVCFAGTLEKMTRAEAADAVKLLGGELVAMPRETTHLVVLGTEPSDAKVKRAEKLGIKLLPEGE